MRLPDLGLRKNIMHMMTSINVFEANRLAQCGRASEKEKQVGRAGSKFENLSPSGAIVDLL